MRFAALLGALVLALVACRPPLGASDMPAPEGLYSAFNDQLGSPDREYTLTMQSDGNLVLTMMEAATVPHRVLWQTNTAGHPSSKVVMQADGNLVLSDPNGTVLWQTNTGGHPGAKLEVRDTGDVMVVAPDESILWSANSGNDRLVANDTLITSNVGTCYCVTSASGGYRIIMGSDGNLQLWQVGGSMVWATTFGQAGDHGVMDPSGWFYLEINSALNNGAVGQNAGPDGYLQVLDSGHVALVTAGNTTVWTSP